MYSFIDGTKRFSIEGGYAGNAPACYALEAYPTFSLENWFCGPLLDLSKDRSWRQWVKDTPRIRCLGLGFICRTLYRFLAESQVLSRHIVFWCSYQRIIVYRSSLTFRSKGVFPYPPGTVPLLPSYLWPFRSWGNNLWFSGRHWSTLYFSLSCLNVEINVLRMKTTTFVV